MAQRNWIPPKRFDSHVSRAKIERTILDRHDEFSLRYIAMPQRQRDHILDAVVTYCGVLHNVSIVGAIELVTALSKHLNDRYIDV